MVAHLLMQDGLIARHAASGLHFPSFWDIHYDLIRPVVMMTLDPENP